MKCEYCDYEWENREPEPKACPRCKRRFDYPHQKPMERKKPLPVKELKEEFKE